MAKKRAAEAPPARRPKGRPPSPEAKGRTRIVVTIRGSKEWEEWLDKLVAAAEREAGIGIRLDRTTVIDVALARLGKALLPSDPAPRRTEGR